MIKQDYECSNCWRTRLDLISKKSNRYLNNGLLTVIIFGVISTIVVLWLKPAMWIASMLTLLMFISLTLICYKYTKTVYQ